MIKEITQFVDTLPEDAFSKNLTLKGGLYIFIELSEDGEGVILKNEDEIFRKKEDVLLNLPKREVENYTLYKKFLDLVVNSEVVGTGKNKSFNSSAGIFMFTATPFGIALKKERLRNDEKSSTAIRDYFKAARKYILKPEHIIWTDLFQKFCEERLLSFIPQIENFDDLKKSDMIYVFLKQPGLDDYKETNENYLKEKLFNKDDFNVKVEGLVFGISDSLSGFNDKKRFLQHKTGLSDLNYRISGKEAQFLWKFFKLQQNKQLPNPTPVFVDKDELNLNMDLVSFYQDDRILSYSEIIKKLIEKHKKQLHNYYLIFFQRGLKGSRIIDLDFVPVFHYRIEKKLDLMEAFNIGGKFSSLTLKSVFDLQYNVFNRIFNNHLVKDTNDGSIWLRFFDELEVNPQYRFTDTIVNLMYKYRKAIYDYIYKSRHQSITCLMFDDMMITSILDDIRHDEDFSRGYSIKEKLNIWFNLYDYFSENRNRINMANKTVEISNRLKSIIDNENEHIENDEEFAFAAGQLIWKILTQSKSANRSHALLEPFLQKVGSTELKKAIAHAFELYKHEFAMYPQKYGFDKLMSEVMGFEPQEENMKNLIHMILAGYFAESLFKKANNQEQ